MKQLFSWRQWTLYALFAGCFYAFLLMCDETGNTVGEFVAIRLKAIALMFVCGYPLCRFTKKWGAGTKFNKHK